jgi:Fe-S cluster assembly protein SufD
MFDIKFDAQDYLPEKISHQIEFRDNAWQFFEKNAFPKKSEVWKYTDLSKFIPSSQSLLKIEGRPDFERDKIEKLKDSHRISFVFYDGKLDELSSDIDTLFDEGGYIKRIASVKSEVTYTKDEFMRALNDAAHTDGLHIAIGANMKVNHEVEFIYIASDTASGKVHNYKNIFEVEAYAELKVIEKFAVLGNDTSNQTFNIQSESHLHEGAKLSSDIVLNHSEVAFSVIHSFKANQKKHSQLAYTNIALKNDLNRFDINILLNEEGAEASVNGATIASDNAHTDHHIYVEHNASHTTSNVKYRMMASDNASATFNAKALASKTVKGIKAFQNNKNLLLSNTAEINTKPELEIYADDVVCSHGATVGQLDDTAIYYIMTRGIPESEAKKMLTESFIVDALNDENQNKTDYHSDIVHKLNQIL